MADPLDRIANLRAVNFTLWKELAEQAEMHVGADKVVILERALMRSRCEETILAIADNDERIAAALKQLAQ